MKRGRAAVVCKLHLYLKHLTCVSPITRAAPLPIAHTDPSHTRQHPLSQSLSHSLSHSLMKQAARDTKPDNHNQQANASTHAPILAQKSSRAANHFVIGQPGISYGLQLRKPASPTPGAAHGRARASRGLFDDDDTNDDDDDENARENGRKARDVALAAAQRRSEVKTQHMLAAAQAEDPSCFDYDGFIESRAQSDTTTKMTQKNAMASTRGASAAETGLPASRYINHLLAAASRRDAEHELLRERKLAREAREALMADGMADTERFVTAGYKRKLSEDAAAREALASIDRADEDHLKTGGRDVHAFYRNILKSDERDERLTEKMKTEKREMKMEEDEERRRRRREVGNEKREGDRVLEVRVQPEGSLRMPTDLNQQHGERGAQVMAEEKQQRDVQMENRTQKEKDDVNTTEDKAASARERYLARKRQRAAQDASS